MPRFLQTRKKVRYGPYRQTPVATILFFLLLVFHFAPFAAAPVYAASGNQNPNLFKRVINRLFPPAISPIPTPKNEVLAEQEDPITPRAPALDLEPLELRIASLENQLQFGTQSQESSLFSSGTNLIRNSSFESADGEKPRQWSYMYDSTSSNTKQSKEGIRSGTYGIKFAGSTSRVGGSDLGISQPETETVPQRTYTLSVYLKHTNVEGDTFVRIGFWDKYHNTFGPMKTVPLSGTKDWYRISSTVETTGLITDWANWYPMLEVRGLKEGGAVYMDDIQLEEGSVLTVYNSAVAGGTTNRFITTFGDGSILGTPTGTIYPAQNGIGSLGTTSNRWHDLYLSKATINENGDLGLDGDATVGGDLTVNDSTTLKGNVTFGDSSSDTITFTGTPTFSNNSTFKGGITVGANGEFTVNSSGDITKIRGVAYSFPSAQGAANEILINDGAGALSWGTFGAASVTADSLDFAQFADAMNVDADTSINLYSSGATDLRFFNSNSGSELLFLDGSTGRVGIGTTNPGAKLEVKGPTIFNNGNLDQYTNIDNAFVNVLRSSKSRGTYASPTTLSDGDDIVRLDGRSFTTGTTYGQAVKVLGESDGVSSSGNSPGKLSLWTTPTGAVVAVERLTIRQNGLVGIGTTAPAYALDVNGDINISSGNTYKINGVDVLGATSLGSAITGSSLTSVGALDAGSITSGFGSIDVGDDTITTTGAISGGTLADGTTTFADTAWTSTSGVAWDLANSSTTALNVENGLFTLDTQNSRVGIGTTGPSELLTIQSSLNNPANIRLIRNDAVINNGEIMGQILFAGNSTGVTDAVGAKIVVEGAAGWGGVDDYPTEMQFWTSPNTGTPRQRMVIDMDGNVGIGTTLPASLLDVAGTTWLRGATGGTSGLFVNSSGNVGIGTTAPDKLLNITGADSTIYASSGASPSPSSFIGLAINNTDTTSGASSFMSFSKAGTGTALWYQGIVGGTLHSDGEFVIGHRTGSSSYAEALRINKSGLVGIGTTNPGAKLEVAGGGKFGYLGSGITAPSSGLLIQGNVGIGTTAPAYKLDVAGDINTTGDIRKNGTAYTNPDYVFEPDYDLMSLESLKTYVATNKHLPGVPSSEDILRDGVKLFEQTRLNLEKTEEAYLYLFDLDKRVSDLSLSLPTITSALPSLAQQNGSQTLSVATTAPQGGLQLDEQSSQELAKLLEGLELNGETGAWEVKPEVTFVGKLVSKAQAVFEQAVTFMAEVTFGDRVTFGDHDMGGFAIIKKGSDAVDIAFEKPYGQTPIVTAGLSTDDETVEGQILEADLTWNIRKESTTGFTIKLNKPAAVDTRFSWTALSIKDVKTVESASSPQAPPTQTPSPTISPLPENISPTPSQMPETVSPSPTPTPSDVPQNSPIPSPEAPSDPGTSTPTSQTE